MDLTQLQRRLVAAARMDAPSDRVPYAFEKRVMARLIVRPALDHATVWANALWRGLAPCVAIMLLLSAWSFFAGSANAPVTDLSQDLENTVFAAVDQDQPLDSVQ